MKEPARLYAALTSVLTLLVAYGLITADKIALWQGLLAAAIPWIQGEFTRREVTPVATVNEAGMTTSELKAMAADPDVIPVKEN